MAKIKLKKTAAKADNTSVKKPMVLESRYSDSLNKKAKLNLKVAKEYYKDAKYRTSPGSEQQKYAMDTYSKLSGDAYNINKEYEKSKTKLPPKK
jgi:hypothetical protein